MHVVVHGQRRFGAFDVDLTAGELRKHGRRIRLQEKPFRVLVALLACPGETVTRRELCDRLWPADTFVDFDGGLNNAVNRLRFALGDSANAPRFIETVGRRGYRFIGEVIDVASTPTTEASLVQTDLSQEDPRQARREPSSFVEALARLRWPLTGWSKTQVAVAGCGFLIVALGFAVRSRGTLWLPSQSATLSLNAASGIHGIAVLPLTNLSGDTSQDYLAYSVTDALTTELARLAPLKVISQTSAMSYRSGAVPPLHQVAQELGVDAIVEGSINREGERIHVNVRIADIPSHRYVWAERFDGSTTDLVTLHAGVVRGVLDEVHRRMLPAPRIGRIRPSTDNREAYELYVKGSFLMQQGGSLSQAVDYFTQALALDRDIAPAYAEIALARFRQEISSQNGRLNYETEVKQAVDRALALNPDLAEAQAALGFTRRHYEWDWAGAEQAFKRATQLNANVVLAHTEYEFLLLGLARFDEAIVEGQKATALDPRSAISWMNEGRGLQAARRYPEAEDRYQRALALKPDLRGALQSLTGLYVAQRRLVEARRTLRRLEAIAAGRSARWLDASLAVASAQPAAARRALRELGAPSSPSEVRAAAGLLSALGERDKAFAMLERATSERSIEPINLLGPELDRMRSDPRFAEVLKRMRLPDETVDVFVRLPEILSNRQVRQTQ